MDSDVEGRLRDTLGRHAEAAPAGQDMLGAVRRESGRRRTRRAVVGAGLAAVVTVAALGLARWLVPGATPVVVPAAPGAATLVPGGTLAPTFPLTPHAALLGQASPVVMLTDAQPTLRYLGAAHTSATVRTAGTPLGTALIGDRPVTVRGHAGHTGVAEGDFRVLTWPERPDLWVEIQVPGAVRLDDVTKYADALDDAPLTGAAPFAFDLVPAGYAIDTISPSAVTFRPPGTAASPGFEGKVAVLLGTDEGTPDGRPFTVAGRPAWLGTSDGYTMLRVDLGGGLSLTIQVPPGVHLARDDLVRLAAGTHPTAAASPSVG